MHPTGSFRGESVSNLEERDPREVRWNFSALMVDVTFFALGMAFLDMNAVLPLLLTRLGASGPLIGAYAAFRALAFSGVQIFVAYAMHGRRRQKPPLAWVAGITRLPLVALPVLLWHAADSPGHRIFALWAAIAILIFWTIGDGLGYVPWMEIVGRAFTDRTRGRFFASTQLTSGLISILIAAFVVRTILHSTAFPYPHNYAILAAVAALMFWISMGGLLAIREPRAPADSDAVFAARPPLATYFRRLPALTVQNPVFSRLAGVQLLIGFGAAASPFYVLYATAHFRLDDSWGGIYQMFQAVGVVVLMPMWTFMGEKWGEASAVKGVALACFLTPLIAFTIGLTSPWIFGLVFLLMGGSLGWGMWIVINHYLLAHVTESERSLFLALINLIFAPSAIYPFLGGLLVRSGHFSAVAGLPVLFLLTAGVTGLGFALTLRLPPPGAGEGAQ